MYQIKDREVDAFFGEYERKTSPPVAECDFCGSEVCMDGESYILSDGRYVCKNCADEVFGIEFSNLPLSDRAEILSAEAVC